jgi:hypothetical protein
MVPAVRAAIGKKRINLVMFMQGSCPPMLSNLETEEQRSKANGCQLFGNLVMDWLRKAVRQKRDIRLVVGLSYQLYRTAIDPPTAVDRRYPGFTNDYITTNAQRMRFRTPHAFRELGRLGIRTDLMGQMPMVYLGAPDCARGKLQCDLPRAGVLKHPSKNRKQALSLMSRLTKPGRLIEPAGEFCDDRVCRGRYQGVPTYLDGNHIGERASIKLAPYFTRTLRELVRDSRR